MATKKVNAASWLKNAMKSIGASYAQSLRELAPNMTDTAASGVKSAQHIVSSFKRGNSNRIGAGLNSNKYVQYAQKAYKNAIADIKSGNFNNTERAEQNLFGESEDALKDLSDSGFSFGDDGADNVNVNVINSDGGSENFAKFSDQYAKTQAANIKAQQANLNASIALSAARMQQIGELDSKIEKGFNDVNSNLTALVNFNTNQFSKYMEASMAYMSSVGAKIDSMDSNSDDSRISSKDLFKGTRGGFNVNKYKAYVKQQFKDSLDSSGFGMIKSLLDDDMIMNQIVSNPLGWGTQMLTSYMMPTVVKTSISSMEKTFNNFMPSLLEQLGDLADDTTGGMIGNFKRLIGKTFGIKNDRNTNFKDSKINKGPIPFDGETKHAITEIIPKELRDQTGYLQIIAEHYNKNAKEITRANGEYWDWDTNSYQKVSGVTDKLTKTMVDAITNTFKNSEFGQSLQTLVDTQKNDNGKRDVQSTLDEFYVLLERETRHLSFEQVLDLVEKTNGSDNAIRIAKRWLTDMHKNNPNAYNNMTAAKLDAQRAETNTRNNIKNNPTANRLFDSEYKDAENAEDIDKIIDSRLGIGDNTKKRKGGNTKVRGVKYDANAKVPKVSKSYSDRGKTRLSQTATSFVESAANTAMSMMNSIMSGDTKGVLDAGSNFISGQIQQIGTKVYHTLFGEREDNIMKGGIFSGVANSLSDSFAKLKQKITGEEYTDSKGEKHASTEDSLLGSFKSAGESIKTHVSSFFKKGLEGWQDAFFGNNSNDSNIENIRKEQQENMKKQLQEAMPAGIGGAAIGAGISIASTGSILGTLVGGPFGAAAIGGALGFLSRNEKFQNYLFGEKDENGERTGGVISKEVQDWTKKNSKHLAGGAAVGGVVGAVTGGGFLGSLIGGPIAGSLLGMATSTIAHSESFHKFLFGDEEKGEQGLIKSIKERFKQGYTKTNKNGDTDVDGGKLMGMAAIGTGTGGLLGSLVGGPVVGAMIGLAASIKASGSGFREWLFGKENGLTLADGTKTKKQGLFGKIGNMLNANIVQPIKTEIDYTIKDFHTTMEYDVFNPIKSVAKDAARRLGEGVGKIRSSIADKLKEASANNPNSIIGKIAGVASNIVGNGVAGIMHVAYKGVTGALKAPVKLAVAVAKALNLKDRIANSWFGKGVKAIGKGIKTGIKGIFKFTTGLIADAFKLVTSPLRLLGKGIGKLGSAIGTGFKKLGGKINEKTGGFFSRVIDNYRALSSGNEDIDDLNENQRASRLAHKKNKEEYKLNKRLNKNGKLIAKLTNGQFSEDSEEARSYIIRTRGMAGLKGLDNDAFMKRQQQVKEAQEKIHGKSSLGMSDEQLAKASTVGMSEQGQTNVLLSKMYHSMPGVRQNEENARAEQTRLNAETDHSVSDLNTTNLDGKILAYYASHQDYDITAAHFREYGVTADMVESIVKKHNKEINKQTNAAKGKVAGSYTLGNIKSFGEWLNNTKLGQLVNNSKVGQLFGNLFGSSKEENPLTNPERQHALGGILKTGLNLVGEKGAELVDWAKGKVFSHNQSKRMIADQEASGEVPHRRFRLMTPPGMGPVDYEDSENDKRRNEQATRLSILSNSNTTSQAERNRLSVEKASIFNAQAQDRINDQRNSVLKKAKTADQLKKEKEEEKYKKDMLEANQRTAIATENVNKTGASFSDMWSKIFSKKGLLFGLFIGGALLLKKHFPSVISGIGSIFKGIGKAAAAMWPLVKSIGGAIGKGISWIYNLFTSRREQQDNTNGNSADQQLQDVIDNTLPGGENGWNPAQLQDDGHASNLTKPTVNFLARHGLNILNGYRAAKVGSKVTSNFTDWAAKNLYHNIKIGKFNVNTGQVAKMKQGENKFGGKLYEAQSAVQDWWKNRGTRKLERQVAKGEKQAAKMEKQITKRGGKDMKKVKSIRDAALKAAEEGGDNVSDTVLSKYTKADDLYKKMYNKAYKEINEEATEKALKKANKKPNKIVSWVQGKIVAKSGDDVVAKGMQKATKEGGNSAKTKIGQWISDFVTKIGKKFSSKAGTVASGLKKVAQTVSKKITSMEDKLAQTWFGKIMEKLTGKTGAAAVSAGLSEIAFTGLSAIDGLTGTAKLFHVSKDAVDGKMRAISTLFGAFTGTTLGSVIDIINSLCNTVFGIDFFGQLALSMYQAWAGKDKATKLKTNQKSFKEDYRKSRNASIKSQWKKMRASGLTTEKYTEFKKKALQGKEKGVKYKGFEDYNTDKNGSITDKIMTGIGVGAKYTGRGIKKGFHAIFGGEKSYQDPNTGYIYKLNMSGTYSVYESDGKTPVMYQSKDGKKQVTVNKEAIPSDVKTYKSKSIFSKAAGAIKNGLNKFGKTNAGKITKKVLGYTFNPVGSAISDIKKYKEKRDKKTSAEILESIDKKTAKELVKNKEVQYITERGNYYQSDGSKFVYYNSNGEKLADNITGDDIKRLYEDGIITKGKLTTKGKLNKVKNKLAKAAKSIGTFFSDGAKKVGSLLNKLTKTKDGKKDSVVGKIIKGTIAASSPLGAGAVIASAIGKALKRETKKVWYDAQGNYYKKSDSGKTYDYYNMNGDKLKENIPEEDVEEMKSAGMLTEGEIKEDSKAKKAINKIQDAASKAWNKAKDIASNGWKKFKKWITGGGSGKGIDKATSGTYDMSSAIGMSGGSGIGFKELFKLGFGGGNGETLNGGTYFSQNDSRWGNKAYNLGFDNGNMATTGCGPTAAAMALSDVTGRNVTPMAMANLAKASGDRDSTGTNWNFINHASGAMGMNTTQILDPTASTIATELQSGNPVILSGTSGGSGTNPYTPAGHYVVAEGLDRNGNIIINDPRGRQYSGKYNLNDVAKHTGSSWVFTRGGRGVRNKIIDGGGFGKTVDTQQWLSVVRAVKRAFASSGTTYHRDNSHNIKITVGGKTKSVRPDCSGFVSACLQYYGVLSAPLTSYGFCNTNGPMKNSGFTAGGWPGWDKLQPGDIIARQDHVEIYAGKSSGHNMVYNCGSTNAIKSAGATYSSYPSYQVVWRPGPAGTGAISSYDSSGTASDSGENNESPWSKVTSFVGNFLTSFGEKGLTGIATGNWDSDYSDALNSALGISNNSGSSDSSSSSGSFSDSNIGNVGADIGSLWKFLKSKGYSDTAAAGILGCWKNESGGNPKRVEGDYLPGFNQAGGFSMVDNRSDKQMDSWTKHLFKVYANKGVKINQSAYKVGNYYWPGIGLAGWTGGRAKNLLDYAKANNKKWSDNSTQLGFAIHELDNGYKRVKNMLQNDSTPQKAAYSFGKYYEGVKRNDWMAKRQNDAKAIYNKYKGTGGGKGGFGNGATVINPCYYQTLDDYGVIDGGFGKNDNAKTIVSKKPNKVSVTNNFKANDPSQFINMMNEIISMMSTLVTNTGATVSGLSALSSIASKKGNGKNIIVKGGDNTTIPQLNAKKNTSLTADEVKYKKIANGGY